MQRSLRLPRVGSLFLCPILSYLHTLSLCEKRYDTFSYKIRWYLRVRFTEGVFPFDSSELQIQPTASGYFFQCRLLRYVSESIGITPVLAMAMLVAIVSEMWTGIRASKVQGIGFESFRFSRCIIKLCIWLAIIYIIHSFYLESKVMAGG